MSVVGLLDEFRSMADLVRPFNEGAAVAYERAAERLACEMDLEANERISPAEAEKRGLGDAETIARKLRLGQLRNHGRKHAPKVRVGDLKVRRGESSVTSITRKMIGGT